MQNIYNPVRDAIETRIAYVERRKFSKIAAQNMMLTGKFKPSGENNRKQLRDAMRASGAMSKAAGSYGRGLRNWINTENLAKLA